MPDLAARLAHSLGIPFIQVLERTGDAAEQKSMQNSTQQARNVIGTLADYAIVVASEANKGGTWSGATQTLKAGWVPVFVLEHPAMPEGNRQLLQSGAHPFPHPFPGDFLGLPQWLQENSQPLRSNPTQLGLFE